MDGGMSTGMAWWGKVGMVDYLGGGRGKVYPASGMSEYIRCSI